MWHSTHNKIGRGDCLLFLKSHFFCFADCVVGAVFCCGYSKRGDFWLFVIGTVLWVLCFVVGSTKEVTFENYS